MTDHAFLVGINDYPTSPLRGCVNDVVDIANFLADHVGFPHASITLLTDRRATKAAIVAGLHKLVGELRPGDRAVFHFSGHGVQLPNHDLAEEADGLDEVVCPVDFSWDDEATAIRDKEFRSIMARIPAGVTFVWISDSCHSGDLTRQMLRPEVRVRQMPAPPEIAWQIESIKRRGARRIRSLRDVAEPLNLAFVSGCMPNQTAADAFFDGRANGALTYFLLASLRAPAGGDRVVREHVVEATRALELASFSQRPTVDGSADQLDRRFLAASPTNDITGVEPPWRAVFEEIDRRVTKDPELARQLTAHTRVFTTEIARVLNLALATEPHDGAMVPRASRGGTVVRAFWWGFHIEVPHQDLAGFLSAAVPINAIAAAIGPATGPAAPFVALAAGFIAGALTALRQLDRGRGVYISMSWFAPGVFVPTTV